MREIIFRGKDRTGIMNHLWQEGSLDNTNEEFPKIVRLDRWGNKMLIDVAPETVGQFTGLTDKNGKQIFEGDIISAISLDTSTEQKAVVGFDSFIDENNGDEYIGFYIQFRGCKTTITQLQMEEVKDRFEVIGNIHDNPEIMED